jgi:hypothetical protein
MDADGQPVTFLGDANARVRAPPLALAPHARPLPGTQHVWASGPITINRGQPTTFQSSRAGQSIIDAFIVPGIIDETHPLSGSIEASAARARATPSSQSTAGFWAALRTFRPRQSAPEYMHEGKYDRDTKRDDDYFP